ncbi:hypothetical protein MKFW12EY_39090 [Methylomonas koyamae]|nr:hypothetical protein MKFW12EY_39090 [Methylomonas koyamae]
MADWGARDLVPGNRRLPPVLRAAAKDASLVVADLVAAGTGTRSNGRSYSQTSSLQFTLLAEDVAG